MSKPHLKIAESVNAFFQNTILSIIFVFNSDISAIRTIFEKALAPILFPLVIIPDAITSLFSLYHFSSAKNKNLGKTFDLAHASAKAALVFTAVFAGLSLIFVQSLFLIAVGSSIIYHAGLSIYHAYHWQKTAKNSPSKTLHKKNTMNNLTSAAIGSIAITGIVLTMVVAPYLGATFLAVAGVGTAAMLLLSTVFAVYRNFKNPELTSQASEVMSPQTNKSTGSSPYYTNANYYRREFRSESLTGNQKRDRKFILEAISSKKVKLENQIKHAKGSILGCLWSEESKRRAKIKYLDELKSILDKNPEETLYTQGNLLQFTPSNAFQSFFKAVGDIEDIAEAAQNHLQQSAR